MQKKTFNILFFCLLGIWILLGILFGKYDLDISRSLHNPNIAFVQYIEKYGEIPGLLLALWALVLMNAAMDIKNVVLRVLAYAGNFILAFFAMIYLVILMLHHSLQATNLYFLADIGSVFWISPALFLLLVMVLLHYHCRDFAFRHKLFSSITIYLTLTGFIVVQTLKNIWGRIRFRDLAKDYSNFSPWYIPQQGGGESFPSGHTLFAWILLPLFLLCLNKNSLVRFFLILLSIVWGFTVGLSRMVIGAHYASDVLFSTGFCVLFFLILYRYFGFGKEKRS